MIVSAAVFARAPITALLASLCWGCLVELPAVDDHDVRLAPLENGAVQMGDAGAEQLEQPQPEPLSPSEEPAPEEPAPEEPTPEAPEPMEPEAPAEPACASHERRIDGVCTRAVWVWEAEGMYHGTGRIDGEGVHADPRMHTPNYMVFGPYTSELPPGDYRVTWRVRTGPIPEGAPHDVLAAVDVNDFGQFSCSVCSIVFRNLSRRSFEGPGRWQPFSVDFRNPGFSPLEFRVYWTGLVDMTIDRVEVQRLP